MGQSDSEAVFLQILCICVFPTHPPRKRSCCFSSQLVWSLCILYISTVSYLMWLLILFVMTYWLRWIFRCLHQKAEFVFLTGNRDRFLCPNNLSRHCFIIHWVLPWIHYYTGDCFLVTSQWCVPSTSVSCHSSVTKLSLFSALFIWEERNHYVLIDFCLLSMIQAVTVIILFAAQF